jgi:uncharacterized membrane protein
MQEFSRASDGGPATTETKWRHGEERYQSEAAEEGRHYLDKPVTLMLLSPVVVVVVVVCVLLFLIYFPEELGFIKNIEKERKKEREKKIRNYNLLLLLLLLLLSINNSVSSFAETILC